MADIDTSNLDAGPDSPRLARTALLETVQRVNDLANTSDAAKGDALLSVKRTTSGTVATTQHAWHEKQRFNVVTDFNAPTNGTSDAYTAFAAAWAAIKTTGGVIEIPPGTYTLNTQWLLDVDLSLPHNYKIEGYGAELKAGAAVTGAAIKVYGSFNNFGVTIEGLHFNHRNNTTVGGCIFGQGTSNLRVINCSVEHHNTKAGYIGIELGPITPGSNSTNSFWTVIDGFRTRKRTGGDGTNAAIGVKLSGAANATSIRNCSFVHVDAAIKITEDSSGVSGGICNGVLIDGNWFEGVTTAIDIVIVPTTGTIPIGLRIKNNRLEALTTFVSITTGGAAAIDANTPPNISDNYLTVGAVTNEIVNPNNQYVVLDNPSWSSVSSIKSRRQYNSGYQLRLRGTQSNLEIANESNNSDYSGGHLVIGSYHLWVESATGKLRMKAGAPTTDNDGTVVGTQT
jgi:hypothetical protein